MHSHFCFPSSRLQLETDLKIEKEWRQTLEDDLQKEKETVSHLRTETQEIVNLKKVNSAAILTSDLEIVCKVSYGLRHGILKNFCK